MISINEYKKIFDFVIGNSNTRWKLIDDGKRTYYCDEKGNRRKIGIISSDYKKVVAGIKMYIDTTTRLNGFPRVTFSNDYHQIKIEDDRIPIKRLPDKR